MDEGQIGDWSLPDRGVFKGEALQNFVNRAVGNRSLEKLPRSFAVVATDLKSGEPASSAAATPAWRCAPPPPCPACSSR
jgi:NTE family protein